VSCDDLRNRSYVSGWDRHTPCHQFFRGNVQRPHTLTINSDRLRLSVRFVAERGAGLNGVEVKPKQKCSCKNQATGSEPFTQRGVERLRLLHRDFLKQRL